MKAFWAIILLIGTLLPIGSEAFGAVDVASLAPVRNIRVEPVFNGLKVSWDSPLPSAAAVEGYKVDYSVDNFNWISSDRTLAGEVKTELITGLVPNATYFVRVIPVYAQGQGITRSTADSVVYTHSEGGCATTPSGELRCWGQMPGQVASSAAATVFPGVSQVESLVIGNFANSCALKQDGTIWCWNLSGSITFLGYTKSPVQVALPEPAASVAGFGGSFCAALNSTQVWCWGEFRDSIGNLVISKTPKYISIRGVESITEGLSNEYCALLPTFDALCWGRDAARPFKLRIPNEKVSKIKSGENVRCLSTTVGSIYCWGSNSNRIVISPEGSPAPPERLDGYKVHASFVSDWSVSDSNLCFVDNSGRVMCWGDNQYGQVTPRTPGLQTVRSGFITGKAHEVQVRGQTICATLVTGDISCWGKRAPHPNNSFLPQKISNVQTAPASFFPLPGEISSIRVTAPSPTSIRVQAKGVFDPTLHN